MEQQVRTYLRILARFKVSITTADNQKLTAFSTDLSAGGIGAVIRKPIEEGSTVTLRFKLPGKWTALKTQALIRRCSEKTPLPHQSFFLGTEFLNPPTKLSKKISKFVNRSLSFKKERHLTFLAALFIFTLGLVRAACLYLSSIHSSHETHLSGFNPVDHYLGLGLFNLIGGLILFSLAVGVFSMSVRCRKLLITFTVFGILAQAVKILMKFSYLLEDGYSALIFIGEIGHMGLLILICMLLVPIGDQFDSIKKSLETHSRMQTDGRPAAS